MSVQAVANTAKFTDEMLAKNFVTIDKGMQNLTNWISHLEGHVGELYQVVEETAETVAKIGTKVKKPGRVKPFLLGAIAGVVVYKYVKKNSATIKKTLQDEGVTVRFSQTVDSAKEVAQDLADRTAAQVKKNKTATDSNARD